LFNHNPLPVKNYPRVNINGKRHYQDPALGVSYPSVTTFLSSKPKPELEEWRKKVGAEEADRIMTRAAARGTKFHSLVEDYLQNKPANALIDFDDKFRFESYKKALNHVDNVRLMEAPLLSHVLKLAGTVDLVADFDGVLSVLDHKTSSKPKRKEWITDYFLQATCYSIAIEEIYNIKIPQLVIMIVVEDETEPQIFRDHRRNYFDILEDRLVEFRSQSASQL